MSAQVRSVPAARRSEVATLRSTTPEALAKALSGDLDMWVRQATQPEPERRYASVAEMAADLDAYLAGEELTVRPASATRRAFLWSMRHPAVAAMALAVILVLAASCATVAVQHARFVRQERLTEERLLEDLKVTDTFGGELQHSVATLPQSGAARAVLVNGAADALQHLSAEGPYSVRVDEELAREAAEVACAEPRGQDRKATWDQAMQIAAMGMRILQNVPEPRRDQLNQEISACTKQKMPVGP